MKIVTADDGNLSWAGWLHSVSWQDSQRSFGVGTFIPCHTPEDQTEYLRRAIASGKQVYMLLAPKPVGLVSVDGSLIENLFVLPEARRQGCGGALLDFAVAKCKGTPTLWVRSDNGNALAFYVRHGFIHTGRTQTVRGVPQAELQYCQPQQDT